MSIVDLLTQPFGPSALDWSQHLEWALVPLRVILGVIVLDAGRGKWMRGISGTGEWMRGLGLPAPQLLARWTASVEVVGGALLVLGLLTPLAALLVGANMVGATWVQKYRIGAPFQGGDVQGYELDVLMVAAAIALVLGGGGPLSLDRWWFG